MRTIFVRSLQSVLTFAAVALLTGANDAGCGLGTVIGGEGNGGNDTSSVTVGSGTVDPTWPIDCPSGMVVQLVCDPEPSSGAGGWIPVEPCSGPNCPPAPPPPDCDPADGNCSPPYPGDDAPVCNPADPDCNPPMPCGPNGAECPPPPPPPPPPPGCSYECVPEGPACPPGTEPMTVCADGGSGSEGTAGGSPSIPPGGPDTPVSNVVCWTECMPHGCGGEEPGGPPQPDPQPLPEPQPAPQP